MGIATGFLIFIKPIWILAMWPFPNPKKYCVVFLGMMALVGTAWGRPEDDPLDVKIDPKVEYPLVWQGAPPDPTQGLMIVGGVQHLWANLQAPSIILKDEGWLSSGGMMGLEWVFPRARIGYLRQVFRQVPSPKGSAAPYTQVGADTDQFWIHGGWRPTETVFIGLGVAYSFRLMRLGLTGGSEGILGVQGLWQSDAMVEWVFKHPFAMSLRYVGDVSDSPLYMRGWWFTLSFMLN